MLGRKEVDVVLNGIRDDVGYFANEAHFQMSFVAKVMELYEKRFILMPEYPIQSKLNPDKIDNIDLLIIDRENNNEKTFIEFKHKTTNTKKGSLKVTVKNANIQITPKTGSVNLGRFDCWSDIERLENYRNSPELGITNAFFILITNDSRYWDSDGDGKFGSGFRMNDVRFGGHSYKKWKSWSDNRGKPNNPNSLGSVDYSELGAISKGRNRVIHIKSSYDFHWNTFITVQSSNPSVNCCEYRRLIVEFSLLKPLYLDAFKLQCLRSPSWIPF